MNHFVAFLSLVFILVGFQNCAFEGDRGVVVENPFSVVEDTRILKVGMAPVVPSSTVDREVAICLDKVFIEGDEFYEDIDYSNVNHQGKIIVGSVREVSTGTTGQMLMSPRQNGGWSLYSFFPREFKRTTILTNDSTNAVIYEILIPKGRYLRIGYRSLVATNGGCDEVDNASVKVTNEHGQFTTSEDLQINRNTVFEVTDNNPFVKSIDVQNVYDGLSEVSSDSELTNILQTTGF